MNWLLYAKLSGMFFLEFAIWGAWMPVLAARLLGPLRMTGKQTGWIYATLPLASLAAFPGAGQLADKYVNAEWILVGAHLAGAVLLFAAARIQKFGGLFVAMLLYCLCYAATLPLATAMISRHVAAAGVKEAYVYMWAPIAWALVGYVLTGWRQWSKAEGDGSDCLKLAAGLSVIMGVFCVLLPPTPPQATGTPILDALSLLGQPNFLLFAIVSMVVAGMMQFYFLGSAPFMQDIGISTKNISAAMAVAQVVQTVATLLLLDSMYKGQIGPAWTMVIGAACWFLLYAAYVWSRKPWLIIPAQSLHGLAYVFFINSGWMFVSNVAYDEIQGSAYGLIWLATNGIGLLLGTNLASIVMDRFRVAGKFQWSRVFAVPLAVTLTGAIVLAIFLHNPVKVDPVKSKPPAATAAVATEK